MGRNGSQACVRCARVTVRVAATWRDCRGGGAAGVGGGGVAWGGTAAFQSDLMIVASLFFGVVGWQQKHY